VSERVTYPGYDVAVASQTRRDELLRCLRQRADWTVDRLADDLEVSRRTVLRDLNHLRERGFHITSMTGPGGGIHLEPTSVLVTSQLAGDQVVALILSVALARANPWMPFVAGAEEALRKIEASLPRQRATELQQLMQRILVGDPADIPAADLGTIDTSLVAEFERAFTDQHLLRFDYRDAGGRQTTRSVEPHGLLVRTPAWYIIAWDPNPDAARLFRADRISNPSVDDTTFVPRPHDLVTGVCPDATPHIDPPS